MFLISNFFINRTINGVKDLCKIQLYLRKKRQVVILIEKINSELPHSWYKHQRSLQTSVPLAMYSSDEVRRIILWTVYAYNVVSLCDQLLTLL